MSRPFPQRRALVAPALATLVPLLDLATSHWPDFIVLAVVGPLLGAALNTRRQTLALAVYAVALTVAVELAHASVPADEMAVRFVAVAFGGVLAVLAARQRERLEDELRRARASAEAAAKAKSDFLAVMSHEIRTPLNAVIGMTDVLLQAPQNAYQRQCVELIHASGRNLLTLINDVLDFSKIESSRLELERAPLELVQCLEESFDLVAAQACEKELDLACRVDPGTPAEFLGDAARLRQILTNLLSNAVKFTRAGGVLVEVADLPADGPFHTLHFSVADTGIGIPLDRRDRLFQAFSQVDSTTTRDFGGTGLGLAISRRLAELMGGRMWAESEPGEGSTFYFTIRVEAVPAARAVAAAIPELKGKRALLLDPGPFTPRVLAAQLQDWGLVAQAAVSAEEAQTWLRQGRAFDVAVVTLRRAQDEGADLLRALRAPRAAQALPFVVLSPLASRERLPPDVRQGVAAQLSTPLKPAQLQAALRSLFGAPPPAPASTPAVAPPSEPRPLNLILAEDNVVNQKVALQLLAQLGYRADVVSNGLELLAALERRSYDAVLLDVHMPHLDGLEAARRIRRMRPAGLPPRLIAMTASALTGDREACLDAGMDDYLSKPVQRQALRAALERCAAGAEAPARDGPAPAPDEGPPRASQAGPTLEAGALQALREIDRDEPGFLRDLIGLFLGDTERRLSELRCALRNGEREAVGALAHVLRSTAGHLGGARMMELCAELEHLCATGSLDGAADLAERLEGEFARLRPALEAEQAATGR